MKVNYHKRYRNWSVFVLVSALSWNSLTGWAEDTKTINIQAMNTDQALLDLAEQSGTQIIFSPDIVKATESSAVQNAKSVEEALGALLAGTDLSYEFTASNVVVVTKKPEAATEGAARPEIIESVVVTAQKREENIQDVPIAITAFDSEGLEKIGFAGFGDLMDKVPSLTLAPYPQGSSALVLTMRGIGQTDAVQISADPGVGVYLDDVYLARGQGLTTDLGDIERVEVLRGPQGTLYGRNTVGGAVKFITAKPTGEFGFKSTLDVGRYGHLRSLTHINLPEYAGVSTKLSYIKSDFDGWVRNPEGDDFGEKDADGYRVDLRWQPSDLVTVDYTYDYGDQGGTSYYQQYQYLPSNPFPFAFPLQPDPVSVSWRGVELPHHDDFITSGHSLTVAWDITDVTTLKSITSYRELESSRLVDTTEAFNLVSVIGANTEQHQFSQEFLITGSASELAALDYNFGVFYFREAADQMNMVTLVPDPFTLTLAVPFVPPSVANIGPYTLSEAENKSAGVYSNVTWTPSILDDRLNITLGLRYSSDTRDAAREGVAPGSTSYSSWDPSIILDYHWNDNIHTYVKYSEAYRSGGFNLRNPNLAAFEPEELDSFEIGLKSMWWDSRLQMNIAWFTQDYTDIQLTFSEVGTSPFNVVTENAGQNTTEGVEADITLIPVEGMRLTANISYLDASNIEAADPFTGEEVAGGFPRPYTSEWVYNVSAEYTFPQFSFGTLSAIADYSYSDEQQIYSGTTKDLRPDYSLLNARITLTNIPMDDDLNLSVSLWGKNLRDEAYQLFHAFGGAILGQPRSYGVNVVLEY